MKPKLFVLGLTLAGILVGPTTPAQPAGPPANESADVFDSWARVASIHQTQGPRVALGPSRRALREHPGSLALLWQHVGILLELGGAPRVESALDSLRTSGLEIESAPPAFTIAATYGRDREAAVHFARIPSPPPGGFDEFQWRFAKASVEIAQPGRLEVADSTLARLASHPALATRETTETPAGEAAPIQEALRRSRELRAFARALILRQIDYTRARADFARGHRNEGLRAVVTILEEADRKGWRSFAARISFDLARLFMNVQRGEAAAQHFERAIEEARALGNLRVYALATTWLGYLYETYGRLRQALELRQESLPYLEAQEDDRALTFAYLGIAWYAYRLGQPDLALEAGKKGLEFSRRTENLWAQAQILNTIGLIFTDAADLDRAGASFDEALQIANATGNTIQQLMIRNNLGTHYWRLGRSDLAIPIYEDLLEIHRQRGDAEGEHTVLNNLGLASENLGRYQQAKIFFRRCIESALADSSDDPTARVNLGRLLMSEGRYDEAAWQFQPALEIARATGNSELEAVALANLGRVHGHRREYESALEFLREANDIFTTRGNDYRRMPELVRMSYLLLEMNRLEDSRRMIDQAEDLATLYGSNLMIAATTAIRSEIFRRLDRPDEARSEARRCLETYQRYKAIHPMQDDIAPLYSSYFALRTMLLTSNETSGSEEGAGITEEAFGHLQRLKYRSLTDYIQSGQRPIRPQIPDSLLARERKVRREIERLRGAQQGSLTEGRRDSLRLEIAEAESKYQSLHRQILKSDPRFRDAVTPPFLDHEAIKRELMGEGTLILDFMVYPDPGEPCDLPLFVFAIDRSGLSVHRLPGFDAMRRLAALAADLHDSPPATEKDVSVAAQISQQLSDSLLGPVAEKIAQCRELVLIPDGYLHRLSFAALPLPTALQSRGAARDSSAEEDDDVEYMIERVALSTVPSIAGLVRLRQLAADRDRDRRWDMAIWAAAEVQVEETGEPGSGAGVLHFADQELDALLGRFPRARVFDSDRPLEESSLLDESRVLHFIAHGYFDDLQPWRSGLYLRGPVPASAERGREEARLGGEAGGGDEVGADGEARGETGARTLDPKTQPELKLEIADIYYMNFSCDLVTLSACETARRELSPGNDLQGFAQALISSGAVSVLATLWPIDDASTPLFMKRFYENLASGMSKAESLRKTQVSFLADERLRHPFYWAPYVLIGEGSESVPLTVRTRGRGAMLLILGGGIALLVALLMLRKRKGEPAAR